jgi:hypothetical protein
MRCVLRLNPILLLLSAGALVRGADSADQGLEFFEKSIRPVLVAECYECHNVTKRKGGLALDHRAGWEKGGDSGPALERGKPEASLLLKSIRHDDPDLKMPKKAPKLDERVIVDFEAWVRMGAPDPRDQPEPLSTTKKKSWAQTLADRKTWWSFQPVQNSAPPMVKNIAWSEHPIDRFILAKLEEKGLAPAPQAEARTLARRLSFALTGLPPTPEEVDSFVANSIHDGQSAEAARRLDESIAAFVDRLFASPHFGEQFARHWMDVVRYADTHGSEHDLWNPWAWRYRDYLIRAFNADVPYDQLMREQIAGDLLPQPRWHNGINESVIGPAMHRFVEYYDTPVDPKREEAIVIDNQIDTLGKAFQGLTLGCARCHDHKFDPISAKDFYALYGIFSSSRAAMQIIDAPEKLCAHDEDLRKLRAEIGHSLAALWRDEARELPQRLRELLREEKGPLPALRRLARATDAEFPGVWQEMKRTPAPAPSLPPDAIVFADFSHGDLQGWRVSGPGLPTTPMPPGFLSLGAEASPPLVRAIQPAGYFSETNSARHGGSLRSPDFTIEKKFVSVLTTGRGGARARLVVENFQGERLLYAQAHPELKSFTTQWVTMSVRANWPGRRAYLEFVTGDDRPFVDVQKDPVATLEAGDGRSMFGVVRIVFHDGPPPTAEPELPAAVWNGTPTTWLEFAEHLTRVVEKARAAWVDGRANDDDAKLLTALTGIGALSASFPTDTPGANIAAQFHALEKSVPRAQRVPGLRDDRFGRDHALMPRGDHTQPGEVVPRRWLEVFGGTVANDRLALANAIASPDNPLTARVMANRVWQWLFGRGLVATPDNFGRLGERPQQPELLDHLAAKFIADGWSVKKLVRYIVTSRTWQMSAQSNEGDPAGDLLSHARVRRLEAESIRDALLAVSGGLKPEPFGPSVPVFWRTEVDTENQPKAGPLDGNGRRSLYLDVRRKFASEFLAAFDFPKTPSAAGRRDETNVPAQSLALLNDPFVQQEARLCAQRVWSECVLAETRVARIYELAFARPPSAEESARALGFVRARGGEVELAAWADLAHALFNMKEFIFIR